MFELKVTKHFAAAHNLREFYGKCENLHGHNWFVEVKVHSNSLNETGLVMDFGQIKKYLNEVLDLIDHKYLNDLPYFQTANPSSENIAKFIFDNLAPYIDKDKDAKGRAKLYSVSAWESDNASATFIAG